MVCALRIQETSDSTRTTYDKLKSNFVSIPRLIAFNVDSYIISAADVILDSSPHIDAAHFMHIVLERISRKKDDVSPDQA